jgi:hypothetical protein
VSRAGRGRGAARAAVCQARAGAAPALSIGPVLLPVAGREPRAAWDGIPRGRLSLGSGTGFACPTFGVKRAESGGPAGRLGPALGPGLRGAGCACARPPCAPELARAWKPGRSPRSATPRGFFRGVARALAPLEVSLARRSSDARRTRMPRRTGTPSRGPVLFLLVCRCPKENARRISAPK